MFNCRRAAILALGYALWLSACGGGKSGSDGALGAASTAPKLDGAADTAKVLNLFIWSATRGFIRHLTGEGRIFRIESHSSTR
jgi:hypothetical protein